jgi:glyoxylate reductase
VTRHAPQITERGKGLVPMKVLVTASTPMEWHEPLERAGHDVILGDGLLDHDGLVRGAREVEAIVSVLTDPIDAAVLEAGAAGSLRVVANIAVGYDNIDVSRAAELGITVCNTPGVLDAATADLAMLLILACTRRAGTAERTLRTGGWTGWGLTNFLGTDLEGSTLGLVGYGRIARAVEQRAVGFSIRVLHHTRHDSAEPGYVAELDHLMSESDVISVHVPLTPETRGLIDARRLRLMRRSGAVVNTARGGIVDEDALANALENGELASAGLDVYVGEPNVSARLLAAPHLVLLPHIGSATWGTRSKMAVLACEDVCRVLEGDPPINPVRA